MIDFPSLGEPELPAEATVLEPELVGAEPVKDEQALERQATDLVSQSKALIITDPATFERAGQFLETLKTQKRYLVEFFEADIQRAHAAWKGLTTKRASFVDPLDVAITQLSARYGTFAREARDAAERERKRLEREAADQERQRLQDEADRLDREAKAREAEALSAPTTADAQALAQDAQELQQQAAVTRDDARHVQAPVMPVKPVVETPKGVSLKSNWTFAVDDKMALVKAVAAGEVSAEALDVNGVYLRARAKADKGTAKIPGVRFYDATSVSHRRT